MAVSDEFMLLDDVQYTKEDWRNRNKIRTSQGSMWLTVPIRRANLKKTLLETEINYQTDWVRKQLNALVSNYSRAPYFDEIFAYMEAAFLSKPTKLVDLTIPLILEFARYLKIDTPITYASDVDRSTDNRMDRIIELCHHSNADLIYTGPAAKAHVDKPYLNANGVDILYQDYVHPEYSQQFEGFETHMSILDLLMNHGQGALEIILSSPLPNILKK